jgi:hypothetical protein
MQPNMNKFDKPSQIDDAAVIEKYGTYQQNMYILIDMGYLSEMKFLEYQGEVEFLARNIIELVQKGMNFDNAVDSSRNEFNEHLGCVLWVEAKRRARAELLRL